MTARFIPNPGSQVQFLSCPVYECLLEGTRGGGKTDVLIMDFAQHVGQGFGPYWRGVLFRHTYKQLDEVVTKTKRWFHEIFPDARFLGSDAYKWVFPTGEELLLRVFARPDDYWNYHGHEYPWIAWEELTNWPTIDCYESMMACSRSSLPNMPRKYRATCNPWGVGHNWVKAYYVDPAPPGVVIVNPKTGLERVRLRSFLFENHQLVKADPEYVRKLRSISNENKRKAWLEGSWDIVAGGILDDVWEPAVHVLPPFRVPRSWRVDRSFDWGSTRPFACIWWAESDGTPARLANGTLRHFPRGSIFAIAEYYGWNGQPNQGQHLLASRVGRIIREKEQLLAQTVLEPGHMIHPGPADASIFDIENGNCIADDMADAGCRWVPADKSPGSRTQGWEKIRTLLANAVEAADDPHLYVFETCRHWIRTVPTLPRDEKNPDDTDPDAEDHLGDATRYRVWSRKSVLHKVAIAGA